MKKFSVFTSLKNDPFVIEASSYEVNENSDGNHIVTFENEDGDVVAEFFRGVVTAIFEIKA